MVREKKPDVVFLVETKQQTHKLEFLKNKLGFDNQFAVDCKGKSGGLMLLWCSSTKLEIQNYSRRHVSAVALGRDGVPLWKMTGFYGHPETARRPEAWSLPRHLASLGPERWLCCGDFNEILHKSEKSNGPPRPLSQMGDFQKALEDCGLQDLGFSGPRFTWCNERSGEEFSCECLDRAVANHSWTRLYNVF
jgi:hypothetical protein